MGLPADSDVSCDFAASQTEGFWLLQYATLCSSNGEAKRLVCCNNSYMFHSSGILSIRGPAPFSAVWICEVKIFWSAHQNSSLDISEAGAASHSTAGGLSLPTSAHNGLNILVTSF